MVGPSEEKASSSDKLVDDLLLEYNERLDAGEQIHPEDFIAEHDEFREQLSRYFDNVVAVESLAGPRAEEEIEGTVIAGETHDGGFAETMIENSSSGNAARINKDAPLTQFGRYRIRKELGRGAMGAVYLAHDEQLDREVALKIPKFETDENEDLLERFYREARAAAALQHPGICPVHDVGELDGQHYITMAFIKGRPLRDFTKSSKRQKGKQVARVIRKIAMAMAEAHEHNVVHRDLKPANIMINEKNEPVVMDFGLARRSAEGEEQLTHTGTVIGTPAYMSPEQVDGDNEHVGPHSDIYSLGVIFYEMLTGQLPFQGNLMSILKQIALTEPKPPSEIHEDIDRSLQAICMKMMAKKSDDRPASMSDVTRDLTQWLQGRQVVADEAEPLETSRVPGQSKDEEVSVTTPVGESAPAIAVAEPEAMLTHGRKQSANGSPPDKRKLMIAGGLGGAAILLGAIVFFVRFGKVDVQITVDDSSLALKVDGDEVVIEGDGAPIRLSAGTHELIVERDGLVAKTDEFVVKKDGHNAIRVAVVNDRVFVLKNGEPMSETTSGVAALPTTDTGDSSLSVAERLTSSEFEWSAPVRLNLDVPPGMPLGYPNLSKDGRTLWLNGSGSILRCNRATLESLFSKPVFEPACNNEPGITNLSLTVSADGLTLVFASTRGDDDRVLNLWLCKRRSTTDRFSLPVKLSPPINSSATDYDPKLSADGLTLYFASRRPGGSGGIDIWIATRHDNSAQFGNVQNLGPSINSPDDERSPCISSDGSSLIFASDRSGDWNFFLATRDEDTVFGGVTPLPGSINTPDDELSPCLSSDGRTLLFSTGASTSSMDRRLWVSKRVSKKHRTSPSPDNLTTHPTAPALVIAPASAGQVDLQRGLVGHWNFEDDDPAYSENLAGPEHGVRLHGSARRVTETPPVPLAGQRSLKLTGNSDMPRTSDWPNLDLSEGLTLTGWTRSDGEPESRNQLRTLIGQNYSENGFQLKVDGRLKLARGSGDVNVIPGLYDEIPHGEWYHIAATYDGSNVRIYLNGELKKAEAHTGELAVNQKDIRFGGQSDELRTGNPYWMDDLRLYTRALSGAEIAVLAGKAKLPGGDDADRKAAEWVLAVGGKIETSAGTFESGEELPKTPFQLRAVDLFRTEVADDNLKRFIGCTYIESVSLNWTQVTDAGVKHLKSLPKLKTLELDQTTVVSTGMRNLLQLTGLTSLNLQSCGVRNSDLVKLNVLKELEFLDLKHCRDITNDGLVHLKGRTNLRVLWLKDAAITDEGLEHLKGLTNLTNLDVSRTKVTADGVAELKKALPNCKITWFTGSAPNLNPESVTPLPVADTGQVDLKRGLVGHWNFEEGQGTKAEDSSGNDNHGTLMGDDGLPEWVNDTAPVTSGGKSSLKFPANRGRVEIPVSPELFRFDLQNEITLSGWRKVNAFKPGANLRDLISKQGNLSYRLGMGGLTSVGSQGTGNRFIATEVIPELVQADGKWHHLLMRCDGRTINVFADGKLVSEKPFAGKILCDSSLPVMLGREPGSPDCEATIDDVRIYNRALSDAEIAVLAGKAALPRDSARELSGNGVSSISQAELLTSPDWTWSSPAPLPELVNHGAMDGAPSFSSDGKMLLFGRRGRNGSEGGLMVSTRSSSGEWSSPRPLGEEIKSYGRLGEPYLIVGEGKQSLYLDGIVGDAGVPRLWVTHRESEASPWSEPESLGDAFDGDFQDQAPSLSADGCVIVFHAHRRKGVGKTDIFVSSRPSIDAEWSTPIHAGREVNTKGAESHPCISSDGLVLMFLRTPATAGASSQLLQSVRRDRNSAWETPTEVRFANKFNRTIRQPALSPDGRTLIFSTGANLMISRRIDKRRLSGAALKQSTSPAPANDDPDRVAAEWTLSVGGRVRIGDEEIKTAADLPAGQFLIDSIMLNGKDPADGLKHLSQLPDLRKLDLNASSIDDAALAHLGALSNLQILEVGDTGISDDGVIHLKQLRNLTNLTFWNTDVGDEGIRHLTELRNLVQIGAMGTRITDTGLEQISLHFQELKGLTLGNTRISDAGAEHLKNLKKLLRLTLDNTGISDTGLKNLEGLTALKYLSLTGTRVTASGIGELKNALPNCQIEWDGNNKPQAVNAPFDTAQAKAHQQAWADYLGMPVEKEVELKGGVKMSFMLIPPGEFMMGSTEEEQTRLRELEKTAESVDHEERFKNEGPQHRVRITQPFYLGKHEVTVAAALSVLGAQPAPGLMVANDNRETQNPAGLSGPGAAELARLLNEKHSQTDLRFGIPTEAQWEYAARAGTTTAYFFGDTPEQLKEHALFKFQETRGVRPVGQLKPNPWGLHDIYGNAIEWCADAYIENSYFGSPVDDPFVQKLNNPMRVQRGGGHAGTAFVCRSSFRWRQPHTSLLRAQGVRLALTFGTPSKPQPSMPASSVEPPDESPNLAWQTPEKPPTLRVAPNSPDGLKGTMSGHTRYVQGVAISPDGKRVLSSSWNSKLRLHDVKSGAELQFKNTLTPPGAFAVDRDFRTVLTGGMKKPSILWDLPTGLPLKEFPPQGNIPIATAVALSSDGKLAAIANSSVVSVWKTDSGEPIHRQLGKHHSQVDCLDFSPDGKKLVTAGGDILTVFDVQSGERTNRIEPGRLFSARYSSDGKLLVGGGREKTLFVWNADNLNPVCSLTGHTDRICSVSLSANARYAATGSSDKTIRVWDIQQQKQVHQFKARTYSTVNVAISPDGRHVVSGGGAVPPTGNPADSNYQLHLWELPPLDGLQSDASDE